MLYMLKYKQPKVPQHLNTFSSSACDEPPSVQYGEVRLDTGMTRAGDIAELYCERGSGLNPLLYQITCSRTGTWSRDFQCPGKYKLLPGSTEILIGVTLLRHILVYKTIMIIRCQD